MLNFLRELIYQTKKRFYKIFKKDQNIYLIYSMGKVGSSAIYNSIKKQIPYADVFHVHFLSDNWLKKILPTLDSVFHVNIKIGNKINSYLKKNPNRKIKIITLTREPIIREVSNIFENWKHLYQNIEKVDKLELKRRLDENDFDFTLNWFDTEFKEFLGFDIYDYKFDKESGYDIYEYNSMEILCIKQEDLREVGEKALKEFIGKNILLKDANKTANKKGNNLYSFLKNNYKTSNERLNTLYSSKYIKHFYSEDELSVFKKKWNANSI